MTLTNPSTKDADHTQAANENTDDITSDDRTDRSVATKDDVDNRSAVDRKLQAPQQAGTDGALRPTSTDAGAALNAVLPSGLSIDKELHGAGVFGRVFVLNDERLGTDSPVKRVVRILDRAEGDEPWHRSLDDRLRQLMQLSIPYVSTPHDVVICPNDGMLLVTDHHYDMRLWDRLTPVAGLEVAEASLLLRQVLTGLAGLHNQGMAHGDVRSKNVFLSKTEAHQQQTAWLGDAAIGPMTWWTKGNLRDADALGYYPPDWQGEERAPSPKADLYAMGLVACEMFLGRDLGHSSSQESVWLTVAPRLKAVGVPAATRKLISRLLAVAPENRPHDAGEALKMWDQFVERQSLIHSFLVITIAAAIFLVALTVTHSWQGQRLERLQNNLNKAQSERESLQNKNKVLVLRNETLKEELEGIPDDRPELTDEMPGAEEAQRFWQDMVVSSGTGNLEPRVLQTKLSKLTGTKDWPTGAVGKRCNEYYKTLRECSLWSWFEHDDDLRRTISEFVKAPWDEELKKQVAERHGTLQEAAKAWKEWAEPRLSWDEIKDQIDRREWEHPATKTIVNRWYLETQSKKSWKLRLKEGEATQNGWGKNRIVRVYVAGKQQGPANQHEWASETGHDYAKEEPDVSEMPFGWKPGQTFGILLEMDGTSYLLRFNTNMIDTHYKDPFGGPLAVWLANFKGRTESDPYKGIRLDFEIEDCPGPPPSVFANRELTKKAKKVLGETVK